MATIKYQRGVGLIEVLVTSLLIATALLVLVTLQLRSLQFDKSAYFRSQANILAYDMVDRMRISRGANMTMYTVDINATDAGSGSGSQAAINAKTDIVAWKTLLGNVLPNGKGGIECNTQGLCSITITWDEINASSYADGKTTKFLSDENATKFIYKTRI